MSGPRAVWCSTRCLRCGHGASALDLAAVGHWSCTLVPCDTRCLGGLGSRWHEKRQIEASPARVTLIRERAAQSADHLAEKRQKWAVMGEVVCDLGKSGNTANATTYNSDFPAQHSRQVTTPATRCVQPSAYRTCRVAVVRTLRALVCPSRPHVGLLFRVWAVSSSRGPAIPSLGNPAHVRNSGLTCGTDGPRAKQRVHMRDALEPRSLSHTANP